MAYANHVPESLAYFLMGAVPPSWHGNCPEGAPIHRKITKSPGLDKVLLTLSQKIKKHTRTYHVCGFYTGRYQTHYRPFIISESARIPYVKVCKLWSAKLGYRSSGMLLSQPCHFCFGEAAMVYSKSGGSQVSRTKQQLDCIIFEEK